MFAFFIKRKARKEAEAKANAKQALLDNPKLTDVDAFNDWFCDDTKGGGVYANSGIFLRLDKLSTYHIEHYVHSLTDVLTLGEVEDFVNGDDFTTFGLFEHAIRDDWKHKKGLRWIEQNTD